MDRTVIILLETLHHHRVDRQRTTLETAQAVTAGLTTVLTAVAGR